MRGVQGVGFLGCRSSRPAVGEVDVELLLGTSSCGPGYGPSSLGAPGLGVSERHRCVQSQSRKYAFKLLQPDIRARLPSRPLAEGLLNHLAGARQWPPVSQQIIDRPLISHAS